MCSGGATAVVRRRDGVISVLVFEAWGTGQRVFPCHLRHYGREFFRLHIIQTTGTCYAINGRDLFIINDLCALIQLTGAVALSFYEKSLW
jgi:hypothetical protein